MDLPTLAELVDSLRPITRATGPLEPKDVAGLDAFLSLAAYADAPDPPAVLRDDLMAAISAVPSDDDRVVAEYLFRQHGEDLDIGGRLKCAAKAVHLADPRQVRARENYVMGQVAFALYSQLSSPLRVGSPIGDGYVFARFHIAASIHEDDWTIRTTRYAYVIHTVRPKVEFFKCGTRSRRNAVLGYRHVTEDNERRLVGITPVNTTSPDDAHWYIVQFTPQLSFGTDADITIEEDVQLTGDTINQSSALHIAGLSPIAQLFGVPQTALLTVHAPRSLVPSYRRNVYSARAVTLDRPDSSKLVTRNDDSPMTFEIRPRPDTRYELSWRIEA